MEKVIDDSLCETLDSPHHLTSPSLPQCSSDPESSEGVSTLSRQSSTFSTTPPRGDSSSEGVEGRVKRTSKVSFAWHFTIHARYHSNPWWCCSAAWAKTFRVEIVFATKPETRVHVGEQLPEHWGRSRITRTHIVRPGKHITCCTDSDARLLKTKTRRWFQPSRYTGYGG